jgi:ribulose-phosphate 3-epimerase
MDGKFAPEETWPYSTGSDPTELKNLKQNFNLEAHLMIEEPEKIIDKWINSGVKRILVHVESLISKLKTQNSNLQLKCQNLANRCKERDIEFGLVLNLETSIEVLDDLVFIIHNSKFIIQLMSIAQIGYHGHPFDEKVIHKIKALREKYPDVKIAVDGGVNESTARKTTEAGADILVVGSAIFDSENVENAIKRLEKIYV